MVNEDKVAAIVDEEESVSELDGSQESYHLWHEPVDRTCYDVCVGYFSR